MNILLLGADGQLGSEWQYQLAKKNCPRNKVDFSTLELSTYNSNKLDITNINQAKEIIKRQQPEFIVNCAAYTQVDKAEEKKETTKRVNTTAVANLAALCAQFEVTLIHYSTDYVFSGDKEDGKKNPKGYTEGHPAQPINWYGQTKWEGEQAIRNTGCKHLILRLSWLCGAYGSNFVTNMLQLAKANKQLEVVDDQKGSPTFTENAVKNTLALIDQNKYGTYHLTSSGLISWAVLAETLFEYANKDVRVKPISSEQFPIAAKRPRFSKLNTKKVEQIDGVVIEPWQNGLKRMLDRLKNISNEDSYHL